MMKKLRQKFFAGGGATATISGHILASAMIVGLMMSCKDDDSSKPTAPNIPVFPEGQSSENSSEISFYSERGDGEFGAAVGNISEFLIGVPAGDYLLTYQTTLGTFHIVFRAKDSAILHIGLQPGDKVLNASLQKGTVITPSNKEQLIAGIWPSGAVDLYYWPGSQPSEVPNLWMEWFKAELAQAIDMIISELVAQGIKQLPFPQPSNPQPSQPSNSPQRHECPIKQAQGSDAPETHIVEMFQRAATFEFSWQTYSVKDEIVVEYEGKPLYQTGCVGSSGTQKIHFEGKSTEITVRVNPNCAGETGTVWDFTVECPKCYFATKPFKEDDPEQCFGAVGSRCEGDAPNAPATKDYNVCTAQAVVAPGSLAHDQCCSENPKGHMCDGITSVVNGACFFEWKEAVGNVGCNIMWPVTFGIYTWDNPTGTHNPANLRAPSGQEVPVGLQSVCRTGKCTGTTMDRGICGIVCFCE